MGHNNREIEIKLRVFQPEKKIDSQHFLNQVCSEVKEILGGRINSIISDIASDIYWKPPYEDMADFARLRSFGKDKGQMTVKHTDKGSNLNRIEIDCVLDFSQGKALFSQLLGKPSGILSKDYTVFFMDENKGESTQNVSVYQIIQKNKRTDVYIEIEGLTEKFVKSLAGEIEEKLSLKIERTYQSLYGLYIEPAILSETERAAERKSKK